MIMSSGDIISAVQQFSALIIFILKNAPNELGISNCGLYKMFTERTSSEPSWQGQGWTLSQQRLSWRNSRNLSTLCLEVDSGGLLIQTTSFLQRGKKIRSGLTLRSFTNVLYPHLSEKEKKKKKNLPQCRPQPRHVIYFRLMVKCNLQHIISCCRPTRK